MADTKRSQANGSIQNHERASRSSGSLVKHLYLVLYNSLLAIGWSMVMVNTVIHLAETKMFSGLYGKVEFWLKIAQSAAIMEVIHSAVGLVASRVVTTFPQVFSRLCILWLVLVPFVMKDDQAMDTVGFPMLLFAWTITEIIRYTFYATNLLEMESYVLTWCRYTFFTVLYPLGVSGEVICLLRSIPIMRDTGTFDVDLPNAANFGLKFHYLASSSLLLYPLGLYTLYTYMLKQRQKVLGSYLTKKEE